MPPRRLKKNLKLGEVTIKDFTQRTVAIIGQKGAGKTTAMRMMLREIDKLNIPAVMFDPTGAAVDADFFNARVSSDKETWPITLEVIDIAWNKRAPLVVDISDLNREDASEFSAMVFPYLLRKQDGVVVVDEIPDLTPQFGKFKSEELIRFNRKCRNRNIAFVFGTQRPASVSKDVLALADVLLVMRLAWPGDMEAVEKILKRKYGREEIDSTMQQISHFGAGEVYVVDFRTSG
jgi:DNA helicase HerA-like ATPase